VEVEADTILAQAQAQEELDFNKHPLLEFM
jgi:hypothetical protein